MLFILTCLYLYMRVHMFVRVYVRGAEHIRWHVLVCMLCSATLQMLGWSPLIDEMEEDDPMGGIVIHDGSLPGGGYELYNFGDTLVHEMGHYLGLLHTFHGQSVSRCLARSRSRSRLKTSTRTSLHRTHAAKNCVCGIYRCYLIIIGLSLK